MNTKSSIRNRLTISIFIGCFIPYLLGALYLKSYIENVLYDINIEHSNQILKQVSGLIDKSLISDMKEEVNMLATSEIVLDVKQGINHYIDYSTDTFTYTEYASEKAVEEYFRVIKESHETVNFIFLGTETGGYMEYPRFSPGKDYDPRLRPWYLETKGRNQIIISEPYITKITNEMVVSFTKQLKKDNEIIGIVGISVSIEDLTNSINMTKIGENGYILVMSPKHRFVVSPKHPEWILKTPDELELENFIILHKQQLKEYETKIDGEDCILNSVINESGLHCISVTYKSDLTHKVQTVTKILISIYILTYGLIFLLIFCITKRITRPILEISYVIRRLTNFRFDNNNVIKSYTKRSDEIGEVAKALVNMQENYFELMSQVNYIDDEIKTIDIEQQNRFKLELSKRNPFHGIVNSINILLDKNYQYFDQLKTKNNEIIMNNELLTATEEELTAQLLEINHQKDFINFLAYHDPLTELPNRRRFIEYLIDKINSNHKGAVVLLDLDDFKEINDIRGHVFGDRVLEALAKRFESIIEAGVFISRFGGDEFLFLIEYRNERSEIDHYLEQIGNLFLEKIKIDHIEIEIHYSMGIAFFPDDSRDVNQLIMDADLAMYAVKKSGKNGCKLFDISMKDYQIKISNIINILRDAIKNDGFKLVYQPQVEVKTGHITGYEALLRLKDSNLSPVDFIDVAEKNGLIIQIGRIVTQKVMEQLYEWKIAGLEIKPVAINFSANQLHDTEYITLLQNLFEQYELSTEYLEIEITENIFLENKQVTLTFLKQLKEMGIKIAIDDFGTGYSSLNYLTFLPVDIIKLDRSLNMKFLEIENVKVMDSLISLVHSLGLTVVAEGIETIDQVKTLKKADCDHIQGYYFSRPLDADQIPAIHMSEFHNY